MDAENWIYLKDRKPDFDPVTGECLYPVLVSAAEFGQTPVVVICRPWASILRPYEIHWYLDKNFYYIDRPWEIAQEVYAWQEIPKPAEPPRRGITYVLPTD